LWLSGESKVLLLVAIGLLTYSPRNNLGRWLVSKRDEGWDHVDETLHHAACGSSLRREVFGW
jgi:hypothetical protein